MEEIFISYMDPSDLRKLQLLELKILLEFKRVCEKHDLQYFLIGGTLLGAVRHKGFIPWDDDIDVGMPREDYEKFKVIAQDELGEEYFYQTYETDSGYCLSFGKIRLNGTEFMEMANCHCLEHKGIWIDVMPLDYVSDLKWLETCRIKVIGWLDYIIYLKYNYSHIVAPSSDLKKCVYIFLKTITRFIPKHPLLSVRYKLYTCFNDKKNKMMFGNADININVSSRVFKSITHMEFEGNLFPAPRDYNHYLESLYGDYLSLPPENERRAHSSFNPYFGQYR